MSFKARIYLAVGLAIVAGLAAFVFSVMMSVVAASHFDSVLLGFLNGCAWGAFGFVVFDKIMGVLNEELDTIEKEMYGIGL